MTITIGLVANVYQEVNALPGWLETHVPFFDDVRVLHSGPGGKRSTDGTIELLESWNIPVEFTDIQEGFGVVRTKALRMSPCDYVMLLDADERFYSNCKIINVYGEGTSQDQVDKILSSYHYRKGNKPDWDVISTLGKDLKTSYGDYFNQGDLLHYMLKVGNSSGKLDALVAVRRHWHDIKMTKPCQDWRFIPDWQMRIVRNDPSIYFDPSVKMHEKIVGVHNVDYGNVSSGPFFDHMHFFFKRMEEDQRAEDLTIYDSISK